MSAECSAENFPPGYKQTEVGVIPEDWHPVTIGDITIKVGSGITPRGGSSNYKEYGRPFVRSQNIGWGILILADLVYIDEDTHKSFSSTELRQGDVLLNITGASIGRCAIADERLAGGNVNQHVCIIRTDSTKVDSQFLNFILLSSLGQQQVDSFQAGGNREGLNFGQIRSIKFPLPSTKAEQKAIAEALSDADALIESLKQFITKKRQIKQGAMQDLLTGKKRLPVFATKDGYKHTEVGLIPEDWIVKPIGDLVSISVGRDLKEENYSIFQDDTFKYPVFSNTVTNEGLYGFYNIPEYNGESLTVVGRGVGLGTAFTRNGGFGAIGRLLVLFPQKDVEANFLTEYINNKVEIFTESGGIPQLTGLSIAKYRIPLPPTKVEQEAIATILSDMDSEIISLEEKLAKARQIKQGMMQELLTGRIRLI